MKFITIDDGRIESEIFSRVFIGEGSDWLHYSDYEIAKDAIDRGDCDKAELVILDLQLDEDDEAGLRLAADLAARGISASIVVLSVSEMQKIICKCFRAGANAYFVKPGDPDDLETVVSSLKSAGPHSRRCLAVAP